MKNCIIVSPYFPPSTLAGVHRARHLAKHLPDAGWNPIVVCVHEAYHEERLDPGLARLVPSGTQVIKVPALSARLTRPFGVGEISLRGMVPMRRALRRLMSSARIDALLITGSPYYPMLLASEATRRFGVPVVLDFQDPWVSAWGATQPAWSKGGVSHLLATMLEPRALRAASFVTSVSEMQNSELALRYPWLSKRRMAAIPIGADREDFAAIRAEDDAAYPLEAGCCNVSYVGTVWPPVMGTLHVLLRSVASLRERQPDVFARLRLHFVGTTANPNSDEGGPVLPIAQSLGIAGIVREVPRRIAYLQALSVLARSDASLIIGSNEPHYSASKIYSCLMSGRPYLSILHGASGAHELLEKAGGGIALSFTSDAERAALEGEIRDALVRLVVERSSLGAADAAVYEPFEAPGIAHRYAAIFETLSRDRTEGQTCA